MSSGFEYLASPYSHPDSSVRLRRFHRACEVAARLMMEGRLVFSPIAHSHPVDHLVSAPDLHNFWMRQDRAILRHASKLLVLMLDGWTESRGVGEELQLAAAVNIPIEYIADESVPQSSPRSLAPDPGPE